jgi:chromosome segregation ATPase
MRRLADSLRQLADRLTGRESSTEDERLVALFRNRAELKKELSTLDDERHRLLDRLKLQEGSTMRVQEQMDALEQYLGRPEEAYKCIAYYELRALWRAASGRLDHFAGELARQQKDRERKTQMAEFERAKTGRAADVDRELVEARVLAEQLQSEQKAARQRLQEMRGFWNYFRRAKLTEEIEARGLRIEASLTQVTDLSDRLHEVDSEPPPVFEGISVEGRRAINLAIIACAESLSGRLAVGGLAELARETKLRRVYDATYGGREQCLAIMQQAARALAELEKEPDDLADIKARTDRIRRTAVYKSANDVVPTPDSLLPPNGQRQPQPLPNVLLEESWDIYRALVN